MIKWSVYPGSGRPMLVILATRDLWSVIGNNVRIRINQAIYVTDLESLEMRSLYHVGDQTISNIVGSYTNQANGTLVFTKNHHWNQMLVEHRTNFYGQHLVGMTELEAPYTLAPNGIVK